MRSSMIDRGVPIRLDSGCGGPRPTPKSAAAILVRLGVIAAALVLPGLAPAGAATTGRTVQPPAPIAILASRIKDAAPERRVEFARITLDEMARAYDEEAGKALAAPRKKAGDPHKLRKWAASAGAYATRLRALGESIGDFTDVDLVVEPHDRVRLIFGAETLIVGGPRLDHPEVMEQHIVDRFCFIYACDFSDTQAAAGSSTPPQPLAGTWSFGQNRQPTFTTSNGLQFTYNNAGDLHDKQVRSLALAADLEFIAETLRNMVRQGTAIDWSRLRLRPAADGERQEVVLNEHDDAIVVRLPALGQNPQVWTMAIPWLRARVEGSGVPTGGAESASPPAADENPDNPVAQP